MTFKANEIEQYPYLVYTDDAGNVYDPNGGGGGGGGDGVIVVNDVEDVLDKTAIEIFSAMTASTVCILGEADESTTYLNIITTAEKIGDEFNFYCNGASDIYHANAPDDYPEYSIK